MMSGEPLFPGQGEADQITKIFKIIGAPNDEKWPGYSSLPNASKVTWRLPSRSKLREVFPVASFSGGISLSDLGLDLLSKLLHMDPNQRISANDALKHPWLTKELPVPTTIENMPKFQARHDTEQS